MIDPQRGNLSRLRLLFAVCAFGISTTNAANGSPPAASPWLVDEISAELLLPSEEEAAAELETIKTMQQALTADQLSNIRYWAPGSANYRWKKGGGGQNQNPSAPFHSIRCPLFSVPNFGQSIRFSKY